MSRCPKAIEIIHEKINGHRLMTLQRKAIAEPAVAGPKVEDPQFTKMLGGKWINDMAQEVTEGTGANTPLLCQHPRKIFKR